MKGGKSDSLTQLILIVIGLSACHGNRGGKRGQRSEVCERQSRHEKRGRKREKNASRAHLRGRGRWRN